MRFHPFVRKTAQVPASWTAYVEDRKDGSLAEVCDHGHDTEPEALKCAKALRTAVLTDSLLEIASKAFDQAGIKATDWNPLFLREPQYTDPNLDKPGWKQRILDVIEQLERIEVRTAPCTHRSNVNRTFLAAGGVIVWCGMCGSLDVWGERLDPSRRLDFAAEFKI